MNNSHPLQEVGNEAGEEQKKVLSESESVNEESLNESCEVKNDGQNNITDKFAYLMGKAQGGTEMLMVKLSMNLKEKKG